MPVLAVPVHGLFQQERYAKTYHCPHSGEQYGTDDIVAVDIGYKRHQRAAGEAYLQVGVGIMVHTTMRLFLRLPGLLRLQPVLLPVFYEPGS